MYEVGGFRYVDMKDGTDVVQGYSVYCLVEESDPNFQGRSAVKVFFPRAKFPEFKPELGDKLIIMFKPGKKSVVAYQKLDG